MDSKYIEHYKYIQGLLKKGKLTSRTADNSGMLAAPIFELEGFISGLTLDPLLRSTLVKLDHVHRIMRNICRHLSVYHLAMVYVEIGPESIEWKEAIDKEMAARHTKLNWQYAYCSSSCVKHGTHEKHKMHFTPGIMETKVECILTFFDSTFPAFIEYTATSMQYKKSKLLFDFLIDDATFGITKPCICASMKNIKFSDSPAAGHKDTIYASFFIPPIPDVDIQLSTTPNGIELKPDERVECLLIFTSGNAPQLGLDKILQRISATQSANIPIAGAYKLLHLVRNKSLNSQERISYIAFSRKRNCRNSFTAASILIHNPMTFEGQLINFKKNLIRHKQEMCLAFIYKHGLERLDAWTIIRRHIDCPLVQCEANGVFGNSSFLKNRVPADDTLPNLPAKRIRTDYLLSLPYSCAIVFLGWGEIRNE